GSGEPPVDARDGRRLAGPRLHRTSYECLGIIDDEEYSASRAIDSARIETPCSRGGGCHPERPITDGELSHDVLSVTDEMQRGRAERGFVESNRPPRLIDPQLRLDARHTSLHQPGRYICAPAAK